MPVSDVAPSVSLIILVSLGVAGIVREYDLLDTTQEELQLVNLKFIRISFVFLGPYTIIHSVNHALVIFSLSFVLDSISIQEVVSSPASTSHSIVAGLFFVILLYALFYPYLEITEYQEIPATENSYLPASIQVHTFYTSLNIVLLVLYEYFADIFGAPIEAPLVIRVPFMLVAIASFVLIPLTVIGHTHTLSSELSSINRSKTSPRLDTYQ